MRAPGSAIVDTRRTPLIGMPPVPGVPALIQPARPGPLPELLVDEHLEPAPAPTSNSGRPPRAALPVVVLGSETIEKLIVYVLIDASNSNRGVPGVVDATDPRDARHQDAAHYVRWWVANVFPGALVVLIIYDDSATLYGPFAPDDFPEDGGASLPLPSLGGTLYGPATRLAIAHAIALEYTNYTKLVLNLSDGMGEDVLESNALFAAAGLQSFLIPYGQYWPFIAAKFGTALTQYTITVHVGDRPHGLAQTMAVATASTTGLERVQ